jgi:hypothetical protein
MAGAMRADVPARRRAPDHGPKRPVSQSCYKLKNMARLRRATQAREPAFRLSPQPIARGDGRWGV